MPDTVLLPMPIEPVSPSTNGRDGAAMSRPAAFGFASNTRAQVGPARVLGHNAAPQLPLLAGAGRARAPSREIQRHAVAAADQWLWRAPRTHYAAVHGAGSGGCGVGGL
jgi:hypothetical protein